MIVEDPEPGQDAITDKRDWLASVWATVRRTIFELRARSSLPAGRLLVSSI
ncbi:hypothetical protein RTCIAT899_PA00895 (plasmid) [Rhizobium tropici CIAT 899]|nr:hypothetical protein RTCIAT899_PA00895 [Rhizobium tropici CIAT 899]